MWQDTSKGDGGTDEGIKFLIAADGQLQVAWRDALAFEIFGGVSCQLEDFGNKVLEDRGQKMAAMALARNVAEVTLDTTAGEL